MTQNLRMACLFILQVTLIQLVAAQFLTVSDNGRYLQQGDGTPFFYLGDTAWELFHRLDSAEADKYFADRARKGFTVIQAVVLAQLGGLTIPNANGDLPFHDQNMQKPNGAYFGHIDLLVDLAASHGLTIGMLPTWGSYWSTINGKQKIFDVENARVFGAFLGERYQDDFIIWIMGGDENINNEEERLIIEAMVEGIKNHDQENLMTFHPRGPGRSSDYFHQTDWLDFNMYQSSHAGHHHDNGLFAEHDLALQPTKPTLDSEPRYELIPAGFYFKGNNQLDLFTDDDARQAAYWSVLAGACGHTYGHNSIWQMYDRDKQPIIGAKIPWYEAIHHPGSLQMKHLRTLFEARPFHQLHPNQQMIKSNAPEMQKVRAALATDASFALIYTPDGSPFTIDQSVIKATKLKSIWYDPRYGVSHPIHTGNTFAIQTYTPPTQGIGQDWILILEDADRDFPLPGFE